MSFSNPPLDLTPGPPPNRQTPSELVEACVSEQPYAWELFVDRYLAVVLGMLGQVAEQAGMSLSDAERDRLAIAVFASLQEANFRRLREWEGENELDAFWLLAVRRILLGSQS